MTGLSIRCWEYAGARLPSGYGTTGKGLTHRLAYEAIRGPIPPGLELDHVCRNRACYNPSHLEAVTHAENMRRAQFARNGGDVCPRGHSYDEGNTYRYSDGRRACRTCARLRGRKNSPLLMMVAS